MLLLVTSIKLVAEIALLSLAGQWLLGLLAGARREANFFYRLLAVLTGPFVRGARWLAPRVVLDRHVPLVAFLLLSFVWLFATMFKIQICLEIGVQACLMNPPTWAYRAFKAGVMFWLVFGRGEQVRALLDRMLQRWPDDAYVLSSRRTCMPRPAGATRHRRRAGAGACPPRAQRGRLVQPGLPARSGRAAGRGRTGLPPRRRTRPKLDRAWYGLGLVLIRLGRHDEAVKALERTTKLQPMSPYGWYQLARVHMDRQARRGAQDHPPPQGLRAQGGGAAGTGDRAGGMTDRAAGGGRGPGKAGKRAAPRWPVHRDALSPTARIPQRSSMLGGDLCS
jgi:hypothetical protein